MTEREPQPYTNDLQEWIGESRDAWYAILAAYTVAALGAVFGALTGRYFIAAVFIGLAITTNVIHYWRSVVSEDLRYPGGGRDE